MKISEMFENLQYRGFIVDYAEDGAELMQKLFTLIPPDETVGTGGSMTLKQLLVQEQLVEKGYSVIDRRILRGELATEVMKKAQWADWFLTSANAITEEGEIVNIDGYCNRTSSMIFGGKNTVIICGINKIVPDLPAAIKRVRTVAAPENCRMFKRNNPCVRGESCALCPPAQSLCTATTIIHYPPWLKRVYVILVNQILGF